MKKLAILAVFVLMVIAGGCSTASNENANVNANANTRANQNMANTNTNTSKKITREEYEKNKQTYAEQAKQLGRKIGAGAEDGWLWTKTRFDLAAADDLRDSTINIDVENGVVTLSGTVATAVQKAKAEQIAKSVEGVKQVKNTLKVAPASSANDTTPKANSNKQGKKY